MTLQQLAAAAGCSVSYLSYLEASERRPGAGLLERLARALDVDPGWLRTGAAPGTEKQVDRLLRRARRAHDQGEREQVQHLVEEIRSVASRGLSPDQKDRVTYLEVITLVDDGDWTGVWRLSLPVMRRAACGPVAVPVYRLGVFFLRAVGLQSAASRQDATDAVQLVLKILNTSKPGVDADATEWGRLAATTLAVIAGTFGVEMSLSQGRSWLAELDVGTRPENRPAAARLLWNLADFDRQAGRWDEALEKLTVAAGWMDRDVHPLDSGRLRRLRAQVLVAARPDRAEEAIVELESIREDLERFGYTFDLPAWQLVMAEAELARGRSERTRAVVNQLLASDGFVRLPARLVAEAYRILGDVHVLEQEPDDARQAYERSAAAVTSWEQESMCLATDVAAYWVVLAGRFEQVLDTHASAEAYRRALCIVDLFAQRAQGAPFVVATNK